MKNTSHDHEHSHVHPGHNHPDHDHLHSHIHSDTAKDKLDEIQALATSFIEGFRQAEDKTSYLRLSGVPFNRPGNDQLIQHLVDARIESHWQIGTASPAFASRELVYMPFPGTMIEDRESMTFTYVSLSERADIDLLEILSNRLENGDLSK